MSDEKKPVAKFLLPYEIGSVEEAGYKFANAENEHDRQRWWTVLVIRIGKKVVRELFGGGEQEE